MILRWVASDSPLKTPHAEVSRSPVFFTMMTKESFEPSELRHSPKEFVSALRRRAGIGQSGTIKIAESH